MPDQKEARILRLFGIREAPGTSGSGGLLLPEVFGAILEALLAGPQPAAALHTIIREILPYKGERVLDIYGSWAAFCDDVLLILQDGDFITEEEGSWSNTARVIPETQLTIVRGIADRSRKIRVTIRDNARRQRQDAIAESWTEVQALLRHLDERIALSPSARALVRARGKVAGISEILMNAVNNPEPPEGEGKPRKPGSGRSRADGQPLKEGQSSWYRQWVKTAGWHTQVQARAAWNDIFPGKRLTSYDSAFRVVATTLVKAGEMEEKRTGGAREYNWVKEVQ